MLIIKVPPFTASVCPRQVGEQRGRWVFGVDMGIMGRPPQPAEERFWSRVDTSGKCWEWIGRKSPEGYGRFWDGDKDTTAHRFAYSLVYGAIPDGMFICHHCDNPGCVRTSHLFMGTHSDNMRDSIAKGRHVDNRGERHGLSRLCENDIYEIRRLRSLGIEQKILAKMWRICRPNVSLIVTRKRWKHI